MLVLAHGAGTDMRHRAMEATARVLAMNGIATLRFNFPYKERGDWRTDPPPGLVSRRTRRYYRSPELTHWDWVAP